VHFDIILIGSGFAAYEIARVAIGRGESVLVIERGGDDLEAADPALSHVPVLGDPVRSGGFDFGVEVPAAFDGVPRYIGLGGTSELWSGKWRRLDRVDFDRTWESRRWPIGYDDLAPWYDRVAADYGWPDWSDDTDFAAARDRTAAHGMRLIEIYEEVPPVRLRAKWRALAEQGPLDIECGAVITGAAFASDDRIDSVRFVDANRQIRDVSANAIVVAAGGIESIHVSHALRTSRRSALSDRYPGFADHPKAFIGRIEPRNRSFVDYLRETHATRRRLLAFGLPENELLAQQIGNHTVFVTADEAPEVPGTLRVLLSLEQFPEAGNFIATGAHPAVSWQVSPATREDAHRFLSAIASRLGGLLGPLTVDAAVPLRGASHHAAALPLGDAGVAPLDEHCRFHDVANLYCVSSAVFPVAGSANPTMTILALARRLADRLNTLDILGG
jgi:choline dehydrogenase-like flavoprotein